MKVATPERQAARPTGIFALSAAEYSEKWTTTACEGPLIETTDTSIVDLAATEFNPVLSFYID